MKLKEINNQYYNLDCIKSVLDRVVAVKEDTQGVAVVENTLKVDLYMRDTKFKDLIDALDTFETVYKDADLTIDSFYWEIILKLIEKLKHGTNTD